MLRPLSFVLRRSLRSTRRSERGSVLLEAALGIGVLLLPMCLGVIEVSAKASNENNLRSAAFESARIGATSFSIYDENGDYISSSDFSLNLRTIDYRIMKSVKDQLGSGWSNVDAIVVYKASTSSSSVPSACIPQVGTTSLKGYSDSTTQCNVYYRDDIDNVAPSTFTPRTYFPSVTNNGGVARNSMLGSPMFLGVWVRGIFSSITGSINNGKQTTQAVFQIEFQPSPSDGSVVDYSDPNPPVESPNNDDNNNSNSNNNNNSSGNVKLPGKVVAGDFDYARSNEKGKASCKASRVYEGTTSIVPNKWKTGSVCQGKTPADWSPPATTTTVKVKGTTSTAKFTRT